MRRDWLERADRVTTGDRRILGEDEEGVLYVPSRWVSNLWDRPFRWWCPLHWPYWWRSRRTMRVVFLEKKNR